MASSSKFRLARAAAYALAATAPLNDNRKIGLHRRVSSDCANGAFYTSPAAGSTFDVSAATANAQAFVISWDTSLNCFEPAPTAVDIALFAPSAQIMAWKIVDYATGIFQTQLDPSWWNSTSSIDLFLRVTDSNVPSLFATVATSKSFTVKYTPVVGGGSATAGSAPSTAPFIVVNNIYHSNGLPSGSLAAAIAIPIFVALGLITVYVFWSRRREAARRQMFMQNVDARMSHISADWATMSAANASAAIRSSLATDGRPRQSSFYGGRASSPFGVDGMAGVGAGDQKPRQRATSIGTSVSFAAAIRDRETASSAKRYDGSRSPSIGETRARTLSNPLRPMPNWKRKGSIDDSLKGIDIPALALVRTRSDEAETSPGSPTRVTPSPPAKASPTSTHQKLSPSKNGYPTLTSFTFPTSNPAPPSPTYHPSTRKVPTLSISSVGPSGGPGSPVEPSPDELMRAYAEKKASKGGHGSLKK